MGSLILMCVQLFVGSQETVLPHVNVCLTTLTSQGWLSFMVDPEEVGRLFLNHQHISFHKYRNPDMKKGSFDEINDW